MMENCASTQCPEFELHVIRYSVPVSSLGARHQLIRGKIIVTESELQYVNKSQEVWAYEHIYRYACDGDTFFFEVGPRQENGEGHGQNI